MNVINYNIKVLKRSTCSWFPPSCHSAQYQLLTTKQFNQALWSRHGFLAGTPLTIRPLIASVFHTVSQQHSFVITTRSGGLRKIQWNTETLSADVCISGSEDGSVGDRRMNRWPWERIWDVGGGDILNEGSIFHSICRGGKNTFAAHREHCFGNESEPAGAPRHVSFLGKDASEEFGVSTSLTKHIILLFYHISITMHRIVQ